MSSPLATSGAPASPNSKKTIKCYQKFRVKIPLPMTEPLQGNVLFESEKSCIITELLGPKARSYGFIVYDKVVEVNEKMCRTPQDFHTMVKQAATKPTVDGLKPIVVKVYRPSFVTKPGSSAVASPKPTTAAATTAAANTAAANTADTTSGTASTSVTTSGPSSQTTSTVVYAPQSRQSSLNRMPSGFTPPGGLGGLTPNSSDPSVAGMTKTRSELGASSSSSFADGHHNPRSIGLEQEFTRETKQFVPQSPQPDAFRAVANPAMGGMFEDLTVGATVGGTGGASLPGDPTVVNTAGDGIGGPLRRAPSELRASASASFAEGFAEDSPESRLLQEQVVTPSKFFQAGGVSPQAFGGVSPGGAGSAGGPPGKPASGSISPGGAQGGFDKIPALTNSNNSTTNSLPMSPFNRASLNRSSLKLKELGKPQPLPSLLGDKVIPSADQILEGPLPALRSSQLKKLNGAVKQAEVPAIFSDSIESGVYGTGFTGSANRELRSISAQHAGKGGPGGPGRISWAAGSETTVMGTINEDGPAGAQGEDGANDGAMPTESKGLRASSLMRLGGRSMSRGSMSRGSMSRPSFADRNESVFMPDDSVVIHSESELDDLEQMGRMSINQRNSRTGAPLSRVSQVGEFLKIDVLGHPDRPKTLGAEIQNGTTIVRHLVKDGLLESLGFLVNDKIVSIDGVPVHDQQGLGAAWADSAADPLKDTSMLIQRPEEDQLKRWDEETRFAGFTERESDLTASRVQTLTQVPRVATTRFVGLSIPFTLPKVTGSLGISLAHGDTHVREILPWEAPPEIRDNLLPNDQITHVVVENVKRPEISENLKNEGIALNEETGGLTLEVISEDALVRGFRLLKKEHAGKTARLRIRRRDSADGPQSRIQSPANKANQSPAGKSIVEFFESQEGNEFQINSMGPNTLAFAFDTTKVPVPKSSVSSLRVQEAQSEFDYGGFEFKGGPVGQSSVDESSEEDIPYTKPLAVTPAARASQRGSVIAGSLAASALEIEESAKGSSTANGNTNPTADAASAAAAAKSAQSPGSPTQNELVPAKPTDLVPTPPLAAAPKRKASSGEVGGRSSKIQMASGGGSAAAESVVGAEPPGGRPSTAEASASPGDTVTSPKNVSPASDAAPTPAAAATGNAATENASAASPSADAAPTEDAAAAPAAVASPAPDAKKPSRADPTAAPTPATAPTPAAAPPTPATESPRRSSRTEILGLGAGSGTSSVADVDFTDLKTKLLDLENSVKGMEEGLSTEKAKFGDGAADGEAAKTEPEAQPESPKSRDSSLRAEATSAKNQLTLLNQNLQFLNFALQQSRDLVKTAEAQGAKAQGAKSGENTTEDKSENNSVASAAATLESEINEQEPEIQRVREELTETKELFKYQEGKLSGLEVQISGIRQSVEAREVELKELQSESSAAGSGAGSAADSTADSGDKETAAGAENAPAAEGGAGSSQRPSEIRLIQLEDKFNGLKSAYRQLNEQYLHAQEEVSEAKGRGEKWLQLKNKFQVDIHELLGKCKGMFDHAANLEEMTKGNVNFVKRDGNADAGKGNDGTTEGGGSAGKNGDGSANNGGIGGTSPAGAGELKNQSMSSISDMVRGMYDE